MFKIDKDKFGHLDSISINNHKSGISLQLIPEFGGVINKYKVKHSPFSFIAGYQDADELTNHHPFFSRSAKLFPFPNRLNLGQYSFNGKQFLLPANFPWSDHAVHGLLYNQAFDLMDSHADEVHAKVTLAFETPSLHQGFPFAFRLEVTYTIDNEGLLTCSTQVTNTGDCDFPMGDAWHPYFTLGTTLDTCAITMPSCQEVIHDNDLPTDQLMPFSEFESSASLQGRKLNHCYYFDGEQATGIEFTRQDNLASLSYQQDASYPFVQLYTPDNEASIAIEPMTCPANAFNNQLGLIVLQPNETRRFQWQVLARYQG